MKSSTSALSPEGQRVQDLFDARAERALVYLADRWRDEAGFEPIDEYRKSIQTWLPADFTITKMMRRPFGFEFTVGASPKVFRMWCTTTQVAWKRVK